MLKIAMITAALIAPAQSAETLSNYLKVHRPALIQRGWQPIPRPRHQDDYPEMVCGNYVCDAKWLDSKGNAVTLEISIDGTEEWYRERFQ